MFSIWALWPVTTTILELCYSIKVPLFSIMTILSADQIVEWSLGAILMNKLINQTKYEYYAKGTGYYGTFWGGHKSYTYYYGVYANYVGTDNLNISQWNSMTLAAQGAYNNKAYVNGWWSTSPIQSWTSNTPVGSSPVTFNNNIYTVSPTSAVNFEGTYYTVSVLVPSASIITNNVTQNISSVASTASVTLTNTGTTTSTQTFNLSTTTSATGSTSTAYGVSAGITASLSESFTGGASGAGISMSETVGGSIVVGLNANFNTTSTQTTTSSTTYAVTTTLTAAPGQTAIAQLWYSNADTYADWNAPGSLTSSSGQYPIIMSYVADNYSWQQSWSISQTLNEAINYGVPNSSYITPSTGLINTGGSIYTGYGYNLTTVVSNYTTTSSSALIFEQIEIDESNALITADSIIDRLILGLGLERPLLTQKITSISNGISSAVDAGWTIDNNSLIQTGSSGSDLINNLKSNQTIYLKGGGNDIVRGSNSNDFIAADLSGINNNLSFTGNAGNDYVYIKRDGSNTSHFNLDLSSTGNKVVALDQSAPVTTSISSSLANSIDNITLGSAASVIKIKNNALLNINNFKLGTDLIEWDKDYTVSLNGPTFIIKSKDRQDQVILRNSINSLTSSGTNISGLAMLNPEIFNAPYNAKFSDPTSVLSALVTYGITNQLRKTWKDVVSTQASIDSFVAATQFDSYYPTTILNSVRVLVTTSSSADQFFDSLTKIAGRTKIPGFISSDLSNTSDISDVASVKIDYHYLASYDDLMNAFGADLDRSILHYFSFGISEGRVPNRFNDIAYLQKYSDVANDSYFSANAAEHYVRHGRNEGRQFFFA